MKAIVLKRTGSPDGLVLADVPKPVPESNEVLVRIHATSVVRGDVVFAGYLDAPGDTAAAVRDGWLHTGDLGELDADGYLFIRGRKKELIVLSTGK